MNIPQELTERRQWMMWRNEYGTKVPYQPNGHRAKSNDPATWNGIEDCQNPDFGLAFVFDENDPFCGVDLDDCITDGVWEPWAQEIMNRFEGVAYGEISPSGTGVKLTTRATKPANSRCTNQKGVECYDRKRFWTVTGKCVGDGFTAIGDGQAAVDWLIEKHLQASERKTGEKRLAPVVSTPSLDLVARGESYADSCQTGSKGNLRNSAFSLAGHLHSLVGESGERLSDEDVFRLLQRWNYRNTDKLRDDELREAAVNGRKNGTPPADKPPQSVVTPLVTGDDCDVDLSGILQEIVSETPSDIPFSPGDFPREAIPTDGIIGDLVEYNLRTSMYPQPELALAGALSLVATITGRKVENEFGARTNIYVLGLGESGAGKEQARKINKNLLQAAGGEDHIGPERIGSSAGLTVAVKERLSCLFQIDEIGHLLATMKNPGKAAHLFNIGTVLMQMYSSSDTVWIGDAYADPSKTPKINQPHAVVYGTCTPEGFWTSLSADNVANGLLGRMLVFEAPGRVPHRRANKEAIPDKLLKPVKWWCELNPGGIDKSMMVPLTARHSAEAVRRYEDHLGAISERQAEEPENRAALWSRAGEKTAKLALIFACSRQARSEEIEISLDDVNRAVQIVNWLTRRMLKQAYDYVASNFIEDNKKRLLRVISKKMTLSELTRRTQWLRSKERIEILSELQESEVITITDEQTKGRNRRWIAKKSY